MSQSINEPSPDIEDQIRQILSHLRHKKIHDLNHMETGWSCLFASTKQSSGQINFEIWRAVCRDVLGKLREINPLYAQIVQGLYYDGNTPAQLLPKIREPSPTGPDGTVQKWDSIDSIEYHRPRALDAFILAFWSLEIECRSRAEGEQQDDDVPPPPKPNPIPIHWIAFAVLGIVFIAAGASYRLWNRPPQCIQTVSGMCDIPAGPFLRGSTEAQLQKFGEMCDEAIARCTASDFIDEFPQKSVDMHAFRIDRYEVTNQDFQRFVDARQGYTTVAESKGSSNVWDDFKTPDRAFDEDVPGANWRNPGGPGTSIADRMNYPVVHITWEEAAAYCAWADKRLPTEAEWEKAARGTKGWLFTWGNDWKEGDRGRAGYVYKEFSPPLAPIGSFPAGVSPYGVHDMLGNVFEWVADWYDDKYYSRDDSLINPQGPVVPSSERAHRVLRGGSRATRGGYLRTAWRFHRSPETTNDLTGFRCAEDW